MTNYIRYLIFGKGRWDSKKGKWSNLERGQWKISPICSLSGGHYFADPRIDPEIRAKEPQTEEMCARCGYTKTI